ncbi:MAG: LysR family transcriptional regulator [Clostridium sp.]|uniref:LysR family transcriptional regulator n=1 Tax=Clostridium sp. TaxID=1506 RepID=UPI0025B7F69B|nr:LysR family transcriptional regulator [Clostridium sp.]MCH3964784.1 LysR family transcriptional regulator [Clostridium sp.]MCI1715255.1 LysR family transcriptional regulator [Clostridium sp.]MCI1799517.1 LysR family transcriptional regulator [Clostridium sp.]MCI1813438.1 LysR family transcriptional regulator [Clostridium sp.]MCI1870329.1 LysR family transcriptional regulator [Clostridium sp.]
MDIKQLRYFLTIAEEGKITGAAKKLNIAQPPLSYHLKLLEEELGTKLMDRGNKKIHLTDAGEILKNRAEQILELVDSTIKELKDFNEGIKGTLSIGTVSSSGATLFPNIIERFHSIYPKVNFEVWEGNTYRILEILNSGVIDIGIVRTPFNKEGLSIKILSREPMISVFRDDLDYFPDRKSITLKELMGKPLIIYRRFEKIIFEACHNMDFMPEIICKSDDARTTLLWAESGIGIALVPMTALDIVKASGLTYRVIHESSLETSIAAICVKDRYMSAASRNFLNVISDIERA